MEIESGSFIWDTEKEAVNIKKHGVDFVTACKVFKDPKRCIMNRKTADQYKPIGKMTRIADFLPRPEELVMPEETIKITILLKKSSIDFFKSKARECHTRYQKMIRELIDRYASQYTSIK